ncbi:MAG TPA: hypothetical protein VK966_10035, partial [Longimicrobiales bacterium]|nr:hypothetical protein [Longimicrobiales bacterium]
DAFGVMFSEGRNVGDFMEALGRGVGGAFLGGLAEFASGKIAQNLAAAAEMYAFAFAGVAVPGLTNPVAAKAAAMGHLKAAGLWSVVAGAAGAGQATLAGGGRGGLSGGVPTGASDIGGRIADRQQAPGPEIHIYVDGIDPDNTRHQDLVESTAQNARDRWGNNARTTVHANQGRP